MALSFVGSLRQGITGRLFDKRSPPARPRTTACETPAARPRQSIFCNIVAFGLRKRQDSASAAIPRA
ncbi:MAG: hypothetical protein AW07_04800 [Candidatus Accumulibacter sp. SK-11]|nr:MAG: hypothetical protein AW07_04800 [Candidatus Accumulibacter sp. SK-11]